MALNLNIVSKFNDKGIREAQASFGGIGKSLAKLGGIIAAAFSVTAITNFTKESLAAAEGVAVANARLDQIAKSMGIFGEQTQAVSNRLKEYAEANEFALATDAEVIKATQAKLLTFKELANTADEAGGSFDRATAAAIDLAAAGFGTAEGNAVQLGKALNDPIKGITALTRSGITFTEAEKEKIKALTRSGKILEAQNMVLAAIETQVGGTALATATASEKMKLAFDNVRETVGAALLPVFNSFADALLPFIEFLLPKLEAFLNDKLVPGLTRAADGFKAFVASLQDGSFSLSDFLRNIAESLSNFFAGDGLSRFFDQIAEMRMKLFDAMNKAIPGIADALIKALPGILAAGIQFFSQLITALAQIIPDLIKTLRILLPKIIDALVAMLPALVDGAVTLFTALIDAIDIILPPLISGVIALIPEIVSALISAMPKLVDGAIRLFSAILEGINKWLPDLIAAVIKLIPVIVDALLRGIPALVQAAIQLLTGLAKGLIENAPRILASAVVAVGKTLIDGVKDLLGIRSPSTVFYDIGEDVTTGLADGITETTGQVESAAGQLVSIAETAGTKISKAFDKSLTVISSIPGVAGTAIEETVRLTVSEVRRMAEETEGLFAVFDKRGKLLQSYTGFGQATMVPDVTGGTFDVGRVTDDLNAIYEYMGAKSISAIEDAQNAIFGGTFQQALDTLMGQRTFVNPQTGKSTTIGGNISDDQVNKLLSQGFKPLEPINKTAEEIKKAIDDLKTTVAGAGIRPGGLAKGGFVDTATLAVVGEAGPEVVMPLDRFERAIGLGAKPAEGSTYNITVNAGIGSDPVTIGRYVTDAIKRYESVSGKVFASA